MKRLHVVGRKNHGKTGLVVDLIQECRRRGWTVATVKHTHHQHDLDTPGKDSSRHQLAGASAVAILAPAMTALFLPRPPTASDDRYSVLLPHFACHDWLFVEGDHETTAPRIEVWRSALGNAPLAAASDGILALVSDDPCTVTCPVFPRSEVPSLVEWLAANVPSAAMNLAGDRPLPEA